MAIAKFLDEIGTNLNKFQVTTSSGDTYEIKLLRKANITQVGTPLNASNLNKLVDGINANTISISQLSAVARTGSYNDLSNKPTLFDGNYNSLSNKPTSLPASDVYSWAKASTKPTYTASEVGTYTASEIDEKIDTKQNVINANNKIDYSFINNTPTIPTKLSELTNDNRNMYMNSASWVNSSHLPSKGLYILKVSNSQVFGGGYINLGLVNYDGNNTYWSVYYGGQNYRVYLTASGGVNFQQWTGNSAANLSGTTNYYYIKLS